MKQRQSNTVAGVCVDPEMMLSLVYRQSSELQTRYIYSISNFQYQESSNPWILGEDLRFFWCMYSLSEDVVLNKETIVISLLIRRPEVGLYTMVGKYRTICICVIFQVCHAMLCFLIFVIFHTLDGIKMSAYLVPLSHRTKPFCVTGLNVPARRLCSANRLM